MFFDVVSDFFPDIFSQYEAYQTLLQHDFESFMQKKASGESKIDNVPNVPQLSDIALKPSEHVLTGLHHWIS